MNQEQPAVGARKRQQIASTNKQMMLYVAGAAAIVTICVMLVINFAQHISYQMKVNSEWDATNKSLRDSISNIPTLRKNVEALSANSSIKSIQKLVDPSLQKWQVVFDVLPSSCDKLAVEYSFTNIIFKPSQLAASVKDAVASAEGLNCGVSSSGDGGEVVADASGSVNPQSVMMEVNFELTDATAEDIKKALLSLEYSLHPITVKSIEIARDDTDSASASSGTNLTAKISVVTYFVPKASWQPGEKTIPVDENAGSTTGEATE
jgi:hypothetical protein